MMQRAVYQEQNKPQLKKFNPNLYVLRHTKSMNAEEREKLVSDLQRGTAKIKAFVNTLLDQKLNGYLPEKLNSMKWSLQKYCLLESDCCWEDDDYDLSNALSLLDDLYTSLISTKELTVSELVRTISVLNEVEEIFDTKIDEYQ